MHLLAVNAEQNKEFCTDMLVFYRKHIEKSITYRIDIGTIFGKEERQFGRNNRRKNGRKRKIKRYRLISMAFRL